MGNSQQKSAGEFPKSHAVESFDELSFEAYGLEHTDFEKDVILIVNVACKWGFTASSYKAIGEMLSEFGEKGFRVICFPSNQFGNQEPWDEPKIRKYVEENFNLQQSKTFQIANKVEVNGENAAPIYNWLRNATGKFDKIRWNFNTVFLIDRMGKVSRHDSFRWGAMQKVVQKLVNNTVGVSTDPDAAKNIYEQNAM